MSAPSIPFCVGYVFPTIDVGGLEIGLVVTDITPHPSGGGYNLTLRSDLVPPERCLVSDDGLTTLLGGIKRTPASEPFNVGDDIDMVVDGKMTRLKIVSVASR